MPKYYGPLPKVIAGVRMATAVFFLLFGQYKVFGTGFAHGGFQQYLQGLPDDVVRSATLDIDDEANAAGLVLELRIVKPLLAGRGGPGRQA